MADPITPVPIQPTRVAATAIAAAYSPGTRLARVQTLLSVTTADGRTITVREAGDPDGVPLLVHHGTPGSSLFYEPLVEDATARGIRLFSYDRPGYGGSTRVPGRRAADCAADVAAVCDALEIGRFCVWGVSGGGPHVLATAALLPDRVAAAASLASVAPYDAEGLDFTAGMGEQNVVSFRSVVAGEEAHHAQLEADLARILGATADDLVEAWSSLLGPADRRVLSHALAEFVLESIHAGIDGGTGGWFDDDVVFVEPWGFDPASIRVPLLLWHGQQDMFVPFGHGVWLTEHILGVDSRLTADDGHLTIVERQIGEVHSWLLDRFEP
jgi:pimeloyl-ACP methyl ester carboxylesterase